MNLVSRAGWAARAPHGTTPLPSSQVDSLVYHYSASNADEQADHRNCAPRVRGIQSFHMGPSRGWNDIAYNWLVCKHGTVYEGRGFGLRSAATGNDNSHTYAICFLGDDTLNHDDVTVSGRVALVDIARYLQDKSRKRFSYKGHKDFMSTSCPGLEIYRFVHSPRFAELVNEKTADWFPAWAKWRLTDGKSETRPKAAPKRIPTWAWIRLKSLVDK